MAQKDALKQPVEYRYPSDDRPTVPPMESEHFDPPTETWANYWDMNPIEHGGRFVQFQPEQGMWKIVEATPPSVWPEPEHIFEVLWAEPMDVWEDPDDPMTDYTSEMKGILEQFSDPPIHPNAPPFLESVTYYVADFVHRMHGRDQRTELIEDDVDAYWDVLRDYGVDPEDVEGVSDDDLPDPTDD